MNYEQKYNEALKVIESLYNVVRYQSSSDALLASQTIEKAFPELKKSEDERIRKELIQYLKDYPNLPNGNYCRDDFFAWLEKQGEQKLEESISQLTIQGKGVYKICPYCKERMVRDDSKVYTSMPPLYEYNCPKCGTMEFDTVMYDNPEMEEQKPAVVPKFKIGDIIHKIGENTVFPRTIEKIEDGDYVCNNSHSFVSIEFQDDYELVEQKTIEVKPKFKSGDYIRYRGDNYKIKNIEKRGNNFIYNVSIIGKPSDPEEVKTVIGFAAEQDMVEIKQPAWSEEDEKIYSLIYSAIKNDTQIASPSNKKDAIDWLKSLKDRVLPQPTQEWSEEDIEIIKTIENCLSFYKMTHCVTLPSVETCIEWLKSLKPNHWKPSEEQMRVLQIAIRDYGICAEKNILESLYNDIKKL